MAIFKFTARDRSGKKVMSEVQAQSEHAASQMISAQGYTATKIGIKGAKGLFGRGNHIPVKEKVIFARQLSTLINASLPLLQSLRMVAKQSGSKPFQVIISQIADDLEGGMAFSSALAKHPDVFNSIFVGVISAAEASGTLDTSLERLADQQERDADIVSKVRGAATYPAIVLLVMIAVVTFMVVKVLPQVQAMYAGFGAKMPFITLFLLDFTHFFLHYWWVIVFGGGFLIFFLRRWMRTEKGAWTVDGLKMKLPIAGPLFVKMYMARFARTCSTLLASGLPLLQVLQITAGSVGNTHVADSINKASEKVRGGTALSTTLVNDPNFLPLVPSMLQIGEQSGALEGMMGKTADYYEKEVTQQVDSMSTIIEPVLMVVFGVVALVVVAAILLPIYGLVGQNLTSL